MAAAEAYLNMQDKAFSLDMQDSLHQTRTTAPHQPWE